MKSKTRHVADACRFALDRMGAFLKRHTEVDRLAVIEDVTGRISVAVWGSLAPPEEKEIRAKLAASDAAGPFWSERVLVIDPHDEVDQKVGDSLLRFAQPIPNTGQRLWHAQRYRSRGGWLTRNAPPPWPLGPSQPPIIVFYSFKGGVGRSTLLAGAAIRFAHEGKRVLVIDGDLDAPGIASTFLASDQAMPPYGLVDYLIDTLVIPKPDLEDYLVHCSRQELTGQGAITIMPAGHLDAEYPHRLSRLDFDPEEGSAQQRVHELLHRLKEKWQPDVILFDARTGYTDLAAMSLSGIGHLHVLCATASGQTWAGLERIIAWLGQNRLQAQQPQADCLLALTMQPRNPDTAQQLQRRFNEESYEVFCRSYYASADEPETPGLIDKIVTIEDWTADDPGAPHMAIPIKYDEQFAAYRDLAEVAEALQADTEHRALAARISEICWSSANEEI